MGPASRLRMAPLPRYSNRMEIVLHLGVHLTDEDRLVRCLMLNRGRLRQTGVCVPGTSRYRQALRQAAHDLRDTPITPETQEMVLDSILDEDDARRVILSSEYFLGVHRWAIINNRFYPSAGERVAQLRRLFPQAQVSVFLAIRDPAGFVPALVADDRSGGIELLLKDTDAAALRWSEMLAGIIAAAPDVPITVWSDEDTPLLWPRILRAITGLTEGPELDGWLDWYADLVTPQGLTAMRRWFEQHPAGDAGQRNRALAALLQKFARPEAMEAEVALPDWTEATTEALSLLYDQDLDVIASMRGVTLLEP